MNNDSETGGFVRALGDIVSRHFTSDRAVAGESHAIAGCCHREHAVGRRDNRVSQAEQHRGTEGERQLQEVRRQELR
jgi:hypothetical protein